MATGLSHEADFRGALHERWSQQNDSSYELVYYDLNRKLDFFEVLLLLEHVRNWIFLRRCTWCRLPIHGHESGTAVLISLHSDQEITLWVLPISHHSFKPSRSVKQRD